MAQDYKKLLEYIGISFNDETLLDMVFTHKSYLNEARKQGREHNERLEFLGDAVLELVVTEFLYRNYPNPEGELTNWRSALVRGKNLATIARKMNLGKYLYLSRGEEKTGGREKNYILANTFEALLGAIYLDQGFDVSKKFIEDHVTVLLGEILTQKLHIDAKSFFQEAAQDKLSITPEYKLIQDEGPDHDKIFTMGAFLGEKLAGTGKGASKQKAEQAAALDAINNQGWEIT